MIFVEIKSQSGHEFDCNIAETYFRHIVKIMDLEGLNPSVLVF